MNDMLTRYEAGCIDLTNGSAVVDGHGMTFTTYAKPGDILHCGDVSGVVDSIQSVSGLTLTAPWSGDTVVRANYWLEIIERVPTLAEKKTTLLANLADIRYAKETSGINIGGTIVRTDPGSQSKLGDAYTSMKNGMLSSINWKGDNGWMTLDLATTTSVASAVANYVQSCFNREKALYDQINAAPDDATLSVIDITAGWPAS